MPVYHGREYKTLDDTKEVWKSASLGHMNSSFGINMDKRLTWIRHVTDIIDNPNASVYDVGCGTGTMLEVLPDTIKFYGNDINEMYIKTAQETYKDRPNTEIELMDFYEFFDSGRKFDYVLITSLFGFFPEEETWNILPKFWNMATKGMAITTLNKDKYHKRGRLERGRNILTSHDPREMEAHLRSLPDVKDVKMFIDIPKEKRSIPSGMAIHVWKNN